MSGFHLMDKLWVFFSILESAFSASSHGSLNSLIFFRNPLLPLCQRKAPFPIKGVQIFGFNKIKA
jgi:hypothetical protein